MFDMVRVRPTGAGWFVLLRNPAHVWWHPQLCGEFMRVAQFREEARARAYASGLDLALALDRPVPAMRHSVRSQAGRSQAGRSHAHDQSGE